MAHTFVRCVVHFVFSTKERRNVLYEKMRPRLFSYLGGLMKGEDIEPLAIGGIDNHVHIMASLPSTTSVADAAQKIKGRSSRWIHQEFSQLNDFAWQEGYGAFSVSKSVESSLKEYIKTQEQHHKKTNFREEFIQILEQHGIQYDERFVVE